MPQLFLGCFQLLLQLSQLSFQFAAALANLARLLLGPFPTLGLLGQCLRQPFDLLLHFDFRRLKFLDPGFELGLFCAGALLLGLLLLLRLLQLLPQLPQLGFQFLPSLANLARLLLGGFPTPGLLSQRLRQPLDLLLHLCLCRLQFLGPGFEPGLFSAGALLS